MSQQQRAYEERVMEIHRIADRLNKQRSGVPLGAKDISQFFSTEWKQTKDTLLGGNGETDTIERLSVFAKASASALVKQFQRMDKYFETNGKELPGECMALLTVHLSPLISPFSSFPSPL